MATEPAAAALPQRSDLSQTAFDLYNACLPVFEKEPRHIFLQERLLDLKIIPNRDLALLMQVTAVLCDQKRFKPVQVTEGLAWRLRSERDAKTYRSLQFEQESVYALIDESEAEGLWSKTIKIKTNLHDAVFRAAIKQLETRGLIKDMKSVENPTRKMYIKASVRPSDRATGGAWYTDSELDEEFVNSLCRVLFDYIWKKSFYRSSGTQQATAAGAPSKRAPSKGAQRSRKAQDDTDAGPTTIKTELDIEDDSMATRLRRFALFLPMPPGYQNYPTLTDLTAYIDGHPITETTLMESDIAQLLELLIFDNLIERVTLTRAGGGESFDGPGRHGRSSRHDDSDGDLTMTDDADMRPPSAVRKAGDGLYAYRATRRGLREVIVGDANEANGFIGSPCGGCPVFEICEVGGPVEPASCEYWKAWLLSSV